MPSVRGDEAKDRDDSHDFWTLASFAYNLAEMSAMSTSEDDSEGSGLTQTETSMSGKTIDRIRLEAAKSKLTRKPTDNLDEGKRFKKKYELSKEQYKDYQEIFAMLDNDSDGLISVPDLRIALKSIGMTTSKREVFNMIRQGDANKMGCIDFPAFMTLMKRKIMIDMDAEFAELFSVYDTNADGVICRDDIANVYAMSDDVIDSQAIDEMIKEADTNKDGVVDFEEFKEMLTKNNISKFLKF